MREKKVSLFQYIFDSLFVCLHRVHLSGIKPAVTADSDRRGMNGSATDSPEQSTLRTNVLVVIASVTIVRCSFQSLVCNCRPGVPHAGSRSAASHAGGGSSVYTDPLVCNSLTQYLPNCSCLLMSRICSSILVLWKKVKWYWFIGKLGVISRCVAEHPRPRQYNFYAILNLSFNYKRCFIKLNELYFCDVLVARVD